MNDCKMCGREIRLRVMKISFNRKRGVAAWLEPKDGEKCPCLEDWIWEKWRSDKSKPTITERKIAEWNALND